ncbi:MAG: hypothetical protein JWO80_4059 [Bryobacterales bacterium]|jgi:hypothetical protein|nr:hypothetical protein [Bryobacterales bacterium]
MSSSHYTSRNLGGVKRGDGDETGDLEARPTETADRAGSGSGAKVTGDPSALGVSRGETPLKTGDTELDDLTAMDADDPDLGLTDIGDVGPDDWAADTGPTRSGEEAAPRRKR